MITPLPPGTKLRNRYNIVKIIGRGGQCIVYLTYDQFTGQTIVVKCLVDESPDSQERAQNIQLFMKEHLFLSKLDHPSLPKAYEYFQERGSHFLAVEFVPGQNLDNTIKNSGPIKEKDVINWGIQLSKTLVYLTHQKPNPIIVRDIKPSNIQLTPNGEVKIIDFTISREWKGDGDTVRMGSPGYAAPEQYRGKSDIRSDIYSLGVTLYESLTKIDPSLTPFKYHPVRQLNSSVSEEMEKILLKAMDTSVEKRYQHPKEFLDDLKELAASENLSPQEKAKKAFLSGEKEREGKNYQKAMEFYQKAMKIEPHTGEYRCRYGEMLYLLGNLETGLKEIYGGIAYSFKGYLPPEEINRLKGKYELIKEELAKSWPMFSKNPCRTGYHPFETELNPPFETIWQNEYFTTPPKSSPAIGDSMLFTGLKEGRLICIDINTGLNKWTFNTGDAVISSPAYYRGHVYFGSNNCYIYCLRGSDGCLIWKYKTDGSVFSSPAVFDNRLYIGSSDNKLYCINIQNGAKYWVFDAKSSIISSPAISDGKVFFGTMTGSLFGLDASTGQIKWIFDAGGPISSSPSVENNIVYTGSFDGKLYAIEGTGGKLKWFYNTGGKKIETNAAVSEGMVYTASTDSYIYGLDGKNGKLMWQYKTDMPILSSPVIANKVLYVLTNYLYCFEPKSGHVIWKTYVSGPTHSTPAIAGGTLYFTSGKVIYSCESSQKAGDKFFKKGNELFNSGQYTEAADKYRKAININRKHEYLESMARACYLANNEKLYDEAINVIQELIIKKSSAEYSMWLGDLNFKKKEYDRAITYYKNASILNAKLDWPYFRSGLINYRFKAKPQEAVELIKKSINLNPSNPLYLKTLGEIYQSLSMENEAIKLFTRVININPQDSGVKEKLNELVNKVAGKEAFELGKSFMEKGKFDEGISNFEKALKRVPNNGEYHFELGKAYLKKENKNCFYEFDRALSFEKNNSDYMVYAGKAACALLSYEIIEDRKTIILTIEKVRNLINIKNIPENYLLLGELLFMNKNYEEAIEAYNSSQSQLQEVQYKISQCYREVNKFQEGARTLYSLIKSSPGEGKYYKALGLLLLDMEKEKEAVDVMKRALELIPEDIEIKEKFLLITKKQKEGEIFFLNGEEKLKENQIEEAVNNFKKAIEILPKESKYYIKLAETYLYEKSFKEAEENILKAMEISPEKHSYLILLGNALAAQEEYEKAISTYKKAIEACPDNTDYYIKLGETFEKAGKPDNALIEFKKAQLKQPGNEILKQKIDILISYQGQKKWPMAGNSIYRKGFQKYEKEMSPPAILRWSFLKENWVFETKGKIRSSPVIDYDILYIGSSDKNIYAIDIHRGEKKWQSLTGGEITYSPLVYKDCVYTGSADGIIYAFERNMGKSIWMFNIGSPVTSPIIINDTIYVLSINGTLFARSIGEYREKWIKKLSVPVSSSPSSDGSYIYITSLNGTIYKIDINTGDIVHQNNIGGKLPSSPVIKDDFIYIGSMDKNMYSIKKESLEINWTFKSRGKIISSPGADEENLYFGSEDRTIYSLKLDTGEVNWEFKTGGKILASPAIGNNIVYTGSDDGKIYALEASSGRPWEYDTKSPVRSSPAIASSMLFTGSDNGKIYSFRNYGIDETPQPVKEEEKSWWNIF